MNTSPHNQGDAERRNPPQPEPSVEWNIDDAELPEGENPGPDSATDDRLRAMQSELDEARNRNVRMLADYQNYQRRALQNELAAKADGVSSVVRSIVSVVDHFDLALAQDPSKASAEQIITGVRVIREELVRALAQHGVVLIAPAKGDEFTPGRHEAIMQQPAEGVAPGHVVSTFQPGFALGERILRPAKVAIAP